MKQKREKYRCFYCGWVWFSQYNPKFCPRCHNPTNKKPFFKKNAR